jgi:solute:Na+ symporter, SSS family
VGTVVTVSWDWVAPHLPRAIGERDAIFPALIVSLICLFAVSLVTTPPRLEQLQRLGEA